MRRTGVDRSFSLRDRGWQGVWIGTVRDRVNASLRSRGARPCGTVRCVTSETRPGVKLKLDLHDIYNKGIEIDRALDAIMAEAIAKKAPLVEIIPGKGSGQLKKHVLRYLDRKDVKALYHRVEKDSDNFGRVFVHFKHGKTRA